MRYRATGHGEHQPSYVTDYWQTGRDTLSDLPPTWAHAAPNVEVSRDGRQRYWLRIQLPGDETIHVRRLTRLGAWLTARRVLLPWTLRARRRPKPADRHIMTITP